MRIVFTADTNFLGKAIRFFERWWLDSGRVSHVALRFGGLDTKWMAESNQYGFVPNWWPKFIKKREGIRQFEILGTDEVILNSIVDECVDKFIYRKYDYFGLIGFAVIIIWYRLTGKRERNPFGISKLLACSESVYRIFDEVKKRTKVEYFRDHDPETVTPEELYIECQAKPELFKPEL